MFFGDSVVEVTGFNSCAEEQRFVSDKAEQTKILTTLNEKTQSCEVQHVEIQTAAKDTWICVSSAAPYNVEKLAIFLKRILPQLEEELEDSVCAQNICYDILGCQQQESLDSIQNEKFKLGVNATAAYLSKEIYFQRESLQNKIVSALDWNSNEELLAVGFSTVTHESWCNHEAFINIYNIRKAILDRSPVIQTLKTFSCVAHVKFHPCIPTILACGLYNGDVTIWNLSNEDEISFTREKGHDYLEGHCDVVKWLVWKEDRNGIKLVSGGRDGKVIFWKITSGTLNFKPLDRFAIVKQDFYKSPGSLSECLEVNSLGFWFGNESDFVVAAENKVLHCSCKSVKHISWMPNYRDPFLMSYKAHDGLATCVSCLPKSDILASSGIDGKIHVFKSMTSVPIYIINSNDPVIRILWSDENDIISWETVATIKRYELSLGKNIGLISTAKQLIDENILAIALRRSGKLAVAKATGIKLLNKFNV